MSRTSINRHSAAEPLVRRAKLLLGAVAAAGALLSSLAGTANAGPLVTGLFDPTAYNLGERIAFTRTKKAGAHYVKVFMRWYEVAPSDPASPTNPGDPAYKWAVVDRFVRQARASGLEPVLTIHGTPDWARRDSHCRADGACAPVAEELGFVARAAATRYSGHYGNLPRVRYWQAWSEPNLKGFLMPNSPGTYRNMLKYFSSALRKASRRNVVIAGGLAPLARPGATIGPLKFMRNLLARRTSFDIWSTHPYTTGSPLHHAPGPNDVSIGDLPQMMRQLRRLDRAGRINSHFKRVPFWVTEFSWDSRPPDPGGVPMRRHARWTAEALYRMWRAGVTAVFWFGLRDQARESHDFPDTYESGLYFHRSTIRRDRPKLSLQAFRFPFVALPHGRRGVTIWGRTPDSNGGSVQLQAKTRHGWETVDRVRANRSGIFETRIGFRRRPGFLRAKIGRQRSLPFQVKLSGDYYQPPFG
jgi:hypothetical protein